MQPSVQLISKFRPLLVRGRPGRWVWLVSLLPLIAGSSHSQPRPEDSIKILLASLHASELPLRHLTLSAQHTVIEGPRQLLPYIASAGVERSNLRTLVVVTNVTDSDADFSFRLRGEDGSPLPMPISETVATGSESITLPPYRSVFFATNSESPTRIGWIEIDASREGSIMASAALWTTHGYTTFDSTPVYWNARLNRLSTSSLDEEFVLVNPSATEWEIPILKYQDGAGTNCRIAIALPPLGQEIVNVGNVLPCSIATNRLGHFEFEGRHAFTGFLLTESDTSDVAVRNFVEVSEPTSSSDVGPSFGSSTIENRIYSRVGTAIATTILPSGSGGHGSLTYTLAPSVPGLSFNPLTRTLSGTPTTAGTYKMTYSVIDASGNSESLRFEVIVLNRLVPPQLPSGGGIR